LIFETTFFVAAEEIVSREREREREKERERERGGKVIIRCRKLKSPNRLNAEYWEKER
jgi:hypothetical protein